MVDSIVNAGTGEVSSSFHESTKQQHFQCTVHRRRELKAYTKEGKLPPHELTVPFGKILLFSRLDSNTFLLI